MIIRTFFIVSYLLLSTALQANTTLPSGLSVNEWQSIQAQMASNHKSEINITQEAYIKASNSDAQSFGSELALDGNTLAVLEKGEDTMYIFVRKNNVWSQQAYFDEIFQSHVLQVALDNDGDTLVVTSGPAKGVGVYIFVRENNEWFQQAYLATPVNNEIEGYANGFGEASIDIDGDTLVVGAHRDGGTPVDGNAPDPEYVNAGAVFVYTRTNGIWSEPVYITASNRGSSNSFGSSVAVEGNIIAVGSSSEDGGSVGVNNNDGEPIVEGPPFENGSGAVYIFVRNADEWIQTAYIKASNAYEKYYFGGSVDLDGRVLVVGSTRESSLNGGDFEEELEGSGAAYVFEQDNNGNWSQQAFIKASNPDQDDQFGHDVAIDGDVIAVSAVKEDSSARGINGNQFNNDSNKAGAAYLFTKSNGVWTQQAYIKASNTEAQNVGFFGDYFGSSLALDGNILAIGAEDEDSAATGINGDQFNNDGPLSGAVYTFNLATDNQPIENITPQQGLYWNPNASGHGYQLAMVDSGDEDVLVVFVYTYDEANENQTQGAPTWYLSDGAKIDGDQWEAPLRRYHRNAEGEVSNEIVGDLRINFNDDTSGTVSWELPDIGLNNGSEPIERFVFGGEVTELTGAYADLDELGYGITVDAQAPASGMVLYYYDESGHGRWVLGVDDNESGNYEMLSYQGYCLSCPMTEITSEVVGAVMVNDVGNNTLGLDIDITYPGMEGGEWVRNDITMTRLTLPVVK